MANKIKPKRSYTANAVPTTSDVDTHELAINWADGKAFTKNASGQIVTVTLGGGGGSGEDATLRALFVPPAPTSVAGTAGNGQVVLSWTAPTVLAQTPITDYIVQYSSNSGSTWTTFSGGTSTAASATVTGLTNGTGYTFRVAGVNGAGTGSFSTASSSVTPAAGDTLFANVSLLLPADGSGATFVDSSLYARAVTANGNATQSTAQSKFGGKSAYFDGTGDWLSVASVPNIGTQDFSLEWWMRLADVSAYQHIIGTSTSGNFMVALLAPFNGAGAIGVGRDNIAWDFVRNATLSNNTWHHCAISRVDGTMRLYVDGAIVGSSASNSQSYSIGTMQIGATASGATGPTNGYIDDLRLTVGSGRSLTGSTITVPTAAYPTSAAGSDPYFSVVSLLLHMDGSGASFVDSSPTPKTVTANGSATQSTTQSKFGGKSGAFDGSADWLTVSSAAMAVSDSNFTIEAFVYLTSLQSGLRALWAHRTDASSIGGAILTHTNGSVRIYVANSGGSMWQVSDFSPGLTLSTNTWHHVALVRDGNTIRTFLDGTAGTTTTVSSGAIATSGAFSIMAGTADGEQLVAGYMDEFRFTKAARYQGSTLTVPTAAFPDS